MERLKKIAIIGGCGHVGIPLGLALASRDFDVTLIDINEKSVDLINNKKLPFKEKNADEILSKHVGKNLRASTQCQDVKDRDIVFFVTGTPVDDHLNPKINDIINVFSMYSKYLNTKQLIVLRSTVYPGVVELVEKILNERLSGEINLAFCPERVVQGLGIEEIFSLPQLVSGNCEDAIQMAKDLFSQLTKEVIVVKIREAELAKLMTNSWRYLEFAIANQFYMISESHGENFQNVLKAIKHEYPRAKHFASPGLAAGPCLFKDTMQLSAFHKNNFFLGHAAMMINEGLPEFIVDQLEKKMKSLKDKNIALLGLTFKANCDDIRESLSFKIKRILQFKMSNVIATDPYINKDTVSLPEALERADAIILATPHKEYSNIRPKVPYVDCWGIFQ